MKLKASENEIQNAVCEYLTAKKYFFWRNNTVGVYDPVKKVHRKTTKYAKNGVPDIILVKEGWFIGLELKSRTGSQNEAQKAFEKGVKEAGGEYHIIRSVDDVKEIGL